MEAIKMNYNITDDISLQYNLLTNVVDKYRILLIAPGDAIKKECLLILPLGNQINLSELETELSPMEFLKN